VTVDMQETRGSTASKRAFAELENISPSRVSQMIGDGLPVEPNGRIDIEKGRAWITANIDPNRRRTISGDGAVRSSKAKKETADAEISRLKAEKLGGALIDRAQALQQIEGRARFEREAWTGWVNRVAPEIAIATQAEISIVVGVLDRLVREQLATLSETPFTLATASA
jgi:hypothetical protein